MGIRPLVLQGHTRALTRIRVNRDGDLIFTAAKDKEPSVWFTENGERIGTYIGHDGAINDMDVSWDSTRLITAGADDHVFLWDVETGRVVNKLKGQSVIKSCSFGYSGQIFCYTNMKRSRVAEAMLRICDLRDPQQFQVGGEMKSNDAQSYLLEATGLCSVFSHLDDHVTVGVGNMVLLYDLRQTSEPVDFIKENRDEVRDIQLSKDRSCLITASKDRTARMYGARNLQSLNKVFTSNRPVNSAAISPTRPHIALGGGEDAMTVTQTASAGGHFEAKFFHLVYGDEFANIKGHFGPINTLAYMPDGNTFVTGGEDGFVRMNTFDEEFNNFTFDG